MSDVPRAGVQLDHNGAVLTNTIELASRPPTHPMRGQKGSDAEVAGVPPQLEVEDGDQVPRVWIMPVDAVSIDRRIRPRVIGRYCELMHPWRKSVQDLDGLEGCGIKEKHLVPDLVDRDESVASSRKVRVPRFFYRAEHRNSPIKLVDRTPSPRQIKARRSDRQP